MEVTADDPTARALALLSCLTARAHWSGGELAERLGVTTRTVRRDVERLRRLGYDIDASAGTDGGYRLRASGQVPPLFLDDDEAVAVVTALLAAAGEQGMADASTRALAKLHHVLPARVQGRAEAVRRAARSVTGGRAPTVDPGHVAVLAECCRDGVAVRFGYVDRSAAATARRVEPNALVTVRNVWYLVAFDLDRDDWRAFRLDRIAGAVERTGHGSRRRTVPGGDPLSYLGASLAAMPYEHTAALELDEGADVVLARLGWLNPRRVDSTGRRSCRVRLGAADVDELARQIVDVLAGGTVREVAATDAVHAHLHGLAQTLMALTGL
jgi:predicted DNA-binding transcriptional regulator YafY